MNETLRAAACLAAGVGSILLCAVVEHYASNGPWRYAYPFVGPMPEWIEGVPLVAVDLDADADGATWLTERAVFIALEPEDWRSLTAQGDPPRLGEGEALAGVLCDTDEFIVAGVTYEVTGTMPRDASGLAMAYAIPLSPDDESTDLTEAGGTRGFFVRDLKRVIPEEDPGRELPEDVTPLVVHDGVPMVRGLPFVMVAGFALTLYGGAVLQWHGLTALNRFTGVFSGVVNAARDHPILFRNTFLINYGAFSATMLIGILVPQWNLTMSQWVFEQFAEGSLKDLTDAYLDGNVALAAWRTFANNFITQTLIMATIPSLFIPLFGVGKTLLSLTVIGFAMAPAWSSGTQQFTYHWVTMVLELQAYILVSFGICVYTKQTALAIWEALRDQEDKEPTPAHQFAGGLTALASATAYACIALAAAAIYEAVTLILIG